MRNFINTYKGYFIGSLLVILGSSLVFGVIIGTFPTSLFLTRTLVETIFMTMKYSSLIWFGLTGLALGLSYVTNSDESEKLTRNIKQIFKK